MANLITNFGGQEIINKEEAKKQVDSIINHIEWRHGGGTDYVNDDRMAAHKIIDDLTIDHQKVKLPQEVIDELNDWQSDHQDGYTGKINELCGAMWDEDPDLPAVIAFAEKSEENYLKVIDAYRYGWEDEPEAKWYVQTPKEWWEDKNKPEYVDLDSMGISDGLKCKEYAAQFTRAELKKYHFDSDIFTLVPVEADKEVSR